MKTQSTPWGRLVAVARQAPADTRDVSAPHGFATRISALAFANAEPSFSALFARFAPRALGVCALLMVLGVGLNLGSALKAFENDSTAVTLNDPVAEWLNAAS
ncbi:MAG: hypothetical protein WC205_08270 [Opitutaceae bacterium]|jgi:hypothetical protein